MSRLLLVCLSAILWCLTSCTDKEKIPSDVLPKDKMQQVMWDVIQAERYRETFVKDSSLDLKAEQFKLYAQVFAIHDVSRAEFVRSYKFYMSRPDIARGMFDSLSTQATRLRENLYKPKPLDTAKILQPATDSAKKDAAKVNLPKADSIKKAKPVPAPVPAPTPTVTPSTVPMQDRMNPLRRRLPLRKGVRDSLLRLNRKQ